LSIKLVTMVTVPRFQIIACEVLVFL